eukprot:TRINITY_DN243_c1_g1_i5.p1 TRINITY_DN243_c1_g1~~TRINITY_DN243_c1_g1_i5.p1  ORF type:complete len:325 (-),score=48.52 TRINITY_DN243_c1_g1_i5:326-1300(-)
MRSIHRVCAYLNSADDFDFESKENLHQTRERLKKFLGTDSLSSSSWDSALELVGELPSDFTFRATCSRDRNFHQVIGSPDVERDLGGAVHNIFGWKVDCKNYNVEVYSEINESKIVVGLTLDLTLSDKVRKRFRHSECNHRTMLHPALAYSLARICELKSGEVFCDPLSGTGTIPIEAAMLCPGIISINGDLDGEPLLHFVQNTKVSEVRHKIIDVVNWDASLLSSTVREGFVDVVCSDLPFGHRCGSLSSIHTLYPKVLSGICYMLRPGGRAILLAMYRKAMYAAVQANDAMILEKEIGFGNGSCWDFQEHYSLFQEEGMILV